MNKGGLPVWKDVLLTIAGLAGIGNEALSSTPVEHGLVLVYVAMLGIGVPGIGEWYKNRKGGDQ